MWGSGRSWSGKSVVCIACGTSVSRTEAREYDKYGDRWDRDGKEFEYVCKGCHGDLCHLPRDELETLLVDIDDERLPREEFLARYSRQVEERYGPLEEPER